MYWEFLIYDFHTLRSIKRRYSPPFFWLAWLIAQGIFDWGPLLAGRSTTNVKSLYSKTSSVDEIDLVTIPPELCDFMTTLTLKNGSPFTTTVKGSFVGTNNTEGEEIGGFPIRPAKSKLLNSFDEI